MKMRAVDVGDHFVINGKKTFNTECHYSEYHWPVTRTNADPDIAKYKGISLFMVDRDSPSITIRPLLDHVRGKDQRGLL